MVDRQPHPSGGGAQGAEAATSAAQVELDQPSPQRPCRDNQGSFFPPPPHRKGRSGWGGNEQGSHAALCRPCVISTRPRHASHARGTAGCGTAVAATTRGIPGCWGGGGSMVCAGSGGGGTAATGHYALRRARARAGSLIRGRGRGSSRAGSSGAAPRGHAGAGVRPREGLGGGHITGIMGTHTHLTGEGGAMGGPDAGAPGVTSVVPPVFEHAVAGLLGTHAKSRKGASPGNTGGNRPPAGHVTSGQGLAVDPAAPLGGRARLVGVARAGAARTATPGPGGLGRGMPPGAGVAALHRFGGTGTAPTSHLLGG